FRMVYYGAFMPETEPPSVATLSGGAPVEEETTLPTLGGRFVVSCYPLRSKAGGCLGAVHVVRDVTRAHLIEEGLRRSQRMQAVGRLAGGVAHDFNNILTVILNLSDRILSALDATDVLRRPITQIRAAGERAALLTRQLLLFSRNAVVEPAAININNTLRSS